MARSNSRMVVVAGAGIAGLTAALAFAARGFDVSVFERAAKLQEAGAGLQLSPNATRILERLGVLPLLLPGAIEPEAVILRDARTLVELARIPLGNAARRRWSAPYLALRRADLQSALLARVGQESRINLVTGSEISSVESDAQSVTVSVETDGDRGEISALLAVGADGVRSSMRRLAGGAESRFSGQIAWRSTVDATSPAGRIIQHTCDTDCVSAFLSPRFHLIVYPVKGGTSFNLAAFTAQSPTTTESVDTAILKAAMRRISPALARLAEAGMWTCWPIHTLDPKARWTAQGGIALIGDAAHAMTPFAAQGAAMAIEDAETLACHVASRPGDITGALADWEKERRPRIIRVARRGAINRFAWHAAGPVALARNLFLRMRSPESLAADLDWLYGWEPLG